MRLAPILAALSLALPVSVPAAGQQSERPAPPAITIVGGADSPVALAVARLVVAEDGTPSLECVLDNKTDDKVTRVDLLFLAYDSTGRRKTSAVLTLPDGDLPLGRRLNLTARFPLPDVEIQEEDVLRLGLTRVLTAEAADGWADDEFGARSDKEIEAQLSPALVVANPEGSPILIGGGALEADATGGVYGVSLVVTNAASVPARGFTIVAHVFTADGKVAASVSKTFGRPVGLLPRASYPVELTLRGDPVRQGRVWVGVERIAVPAWRNPKTLEQATAAMQRPGRLR